MNDQGNQKRRGFLTAIVAGFAGYATSLVVTKPAYAGECISNCGGTVYGCIWPLGTCEKNGGGFVQYVIYGKQPYGECCSGPGGGIECYFYGGSHACG